VRVLIRLSFKIEHSPLLGLRRENLPKKMMKKQLNLEGFGSYMPPPRRRSMFSWGRGRSPLLYTSSHSRRVKWKNTGLVLVAVLVLHSWRENSKLVDSQPDFFSDLQTLGTPTTCRLDPPWGKNHSLTNMVEEQGNNNICVGPNPSSPNTVAVGLTCRPSLDGQSMPTSTSLLPPVTTTTITRPKIAVVLSYYASPASLLKQLHHFTNEVLHNDPSLETSFTLLIVDDGSPVGLRAEEYMIHKHDDNEEPGVDYYEKIPTLHLVQIDQDLPWNQPGARNLAMHVLGTMYGSDLMVIMLDLDLLLPLDILQSIMSLAGNGDDATTTTTAASTSVVAHSFNRTRPDGISYKEHPSAMAIAVKHWWQGGGGMDEDFSGHYGSEDTAFWERWNIGNNNNYNNQQNSFIEKGTQRIKQFHSDWILQQYNLTQGDCDSTWIPNIVQQNQCRLAKQKLDQQQEERGVTRKTNDNLTKLKRKLRSGCWSNTFLRFPWHYVSKS